MGMFIKKEVIDRDYQAGLDFIDKIDGQLYRIRNWTIISISGAFVFSYQQQEPYISLIGLFIAVFFLYLELIHKSFQDDVIEMIKNIDTNIQEELEGGDSDLIWKDYQAGFGLKLRKPTLFTIIKKVFRGNNFYITSFYIMAAVSSVIVWFLFNAYHN